MIEVTRSSMPPYEEYIDEIKELWDTRWLTNVGSKHQQLKAELENYLGVDNIELFTNGHMAIELSIRALGLTEGEVITTPFTFASTTHAIVRSGLTPVFCDVNEDDYTIDVNEIENLITDKTVAILPVHVYGNICDVEAIDDIANRHNLKVIYDAAHTFGERLNGIGVGTFGDASCFSFHATKVFNTIEGGAIAFRKPETRDILFELRNFGIHGEKEIEIPGTNAKMNEFCAAMGLCNLRHIEEELSKREKVYSIYVEALSDVPGIKLNKVKEGVKSNFSYFPIVVNEEEYGMNRDSLFELLKENGINSRKYFSPPTNSFPCYKEYALRSETPVAKALSESVLTIPMYADLEKEQAEMVCRIIKEGCKK